MNADMAALVSSVTGGDGWHWESLKRMMRDTEALLVGYVAEEFFLQTGTPVATIQLVVLKNPWWHTGRVIWGSRPKKHIGRCSSTNQVTHE